MNYGTIENGSIMENRSTPENGSNAENDRQEELIIRACWLIEDAFIGIRRPHPVLHTNCRRFMYRLYGELHYLRGLAMTVLLGLVFFQIPFWCTDYTADFVHPCGDPTSSSTPTLWYWRFSQFGESYSFLISNAASIGVEFVCISFLWMNILVQWYCLGNKFAFRKDRVAALVLSCVMMVECVLAWNLGWTLRFAPYLRLMLFAVSNRNTRRAFRRLSIILPHVKNIISLLCIFVILSSWLGIVLFRNSEEAQMYMPDMFETMWNLLVLLTTANFPDIMIPVYSKNRLTCLFFIFFLCFGVFFLLNVILAIIYNSFRHSEEQFKEQLQKTHRRKLSQAYQIIQECSSEEDGLEYEVCQSVMQELNHFKNIPYIAPNSMELVFDKLNISSSGAVSKKEFMKLFQVLKKVRSEFSSEQENKSYAPPSKIEKLVRHKYFDPAVDVLLCCNAVLACIESWPSITGGIWLDDSDTVSLPLLSHLEMLFSIIYTMEMLLKLYGLGRKQYWDSIKNRFDGIITVLCLLSDLYLLLPQEATPSLKIGFEKGSHGQTGNQVVQILLLLRLLRITRLFFHVEQFRIICVTALKLIPAAKNIFLIMFCTMYFFTILGNQLFGGKIYAGNPLLANSTFEISNYHPNNFNDYFSGFVTLFELLVVNNWFVLAEGFVLVTETKWARLYFVAFYVIGNIVLLNLVIAVTIDAFLGEYAKNHSNPLPSPSKDKKEES